MLSTKDDVILLPRVDWLSQTVQAENLMDCSRDVDIKNFINSFFFFNTGITNCKEVRNTHFIKSYALMDKNIFVSLINRNSVVSLTITYNGTYWTLNQEKECNGFGLFKAHWIALKDIFKVKPRISNIHIAVDTQPKNGMDDFSDLFLNKTRNIHNNFISKHTKVFSYKNFQRDITSIYCQSSKWEINAYSKLEELSQYDVENELKTMRVKKQEAQLKYYEDIGLDTTREIVRLELRLKSEYLIEIAECLIDLVEFNKTSTFICNSILAHFFKRHTFYMISRNLQDLRDIFYEETSNKDKRWKIPYKKKEHRYHKLWKLIFSPSTKIFSERMRQNIKTNSPIRFSDPTLSLKTKEQVIKNLFPMKLGYNEIINNSDASNIINSFKELLPEYLEKHNSEIERYNNYLQMFSTIPFINGKNKQDSSKTQINS